MLGLPLSLRFSDVGNLVPKLVPDSTSSAELLGRDSLYQARFGSIDAFRLDS
jgi:hypothetical protein